MGKIRRVVCISTSMLKKTTQLKIISIDQLKAFRAASARKSLQVSRLLRNRARYLSHLQFAGKSKRFTNGLISLLSVNHRFLVNQTTTKKKLPRLWYLQEQSLVTNVIKPSYKSTTSWMHLWPRVILQTLNLKELQKTC